MKVSIVIATYNRAGLIGKSIESILNQKYTNIELIVVDDGSTDKTASVVQTYIDTDSRVHYVPLSTNQGATTARNRGIAEASGDLIMVWDSDDVLHSDALSKVVKTFEAKPAYGIVSASCRQLFKDGSERPYKKVTEGEVSLSQVLCKYLPNNEKVRVARAEIFKQVRYEAQNIDFTVNCYLASLGKWYHLDEELGVLHLQLDEVSLTTNRKQPNKERSLARVEPLLRYFEQFGHLIQKNCPPRYAALCYGVSLGLLLKGDVKLARYYVNEALKNDHLKRYKALWLVSHIPGGRQFIKLLYVI